MGRLVVLGNAVCRFIVTSDLDAARIRHAENMVIFCLQKVT